MSKSQSFSPVAQPNGVIKRPSQKSRLSKLASRAARLSRSSSSDDGGGSCGTDSPTPPIITDIDVFLCRQLAINQQDQHLQQKIDHEIRMRDGTAKLLAASKHPQQMLEAAKNLLTSNARMLSYMGELQKRKTDEVLKREFPEDGNQVPCKARVSVSDIRIPLMWKDAEHFRTKGDHRRYAAFCIVKIGTEIYDSALLKDIDRTMTDITFEDVVCFDDITPDFECKLEIYCHRCQDDLSVASTPKRIRKKIEDFGNSVGRTVGRRLSGLKDDSDHMIIGPKFECIGVGSLKLADVSDYVGTFNLDLETDTSGTELPLFGNICCRLAAQPYCLVQDTIAGQLYLQDPATLLWKPYWCRLRNLSVSCWLDKESVNIHAPDIVIPVTKTTQVSEVPASLCKKSHCIQITSQTFVGRVSYNMAAVDQPDKVKWWDAIYQHLLDQVMWLQACETLMDIRSVTPRRHSVYRRKGLSMYDDAHLQDSSSPMTKMLNRLNIPEQREEEALEESQAMESAKVKDTDTKAIDSTKVVEVTVVDGSKHADTKVTDKSGKVTADSPEVKANDPQSVNGATDPDRLSQTSSEHSSSTELSASMLESSTEEVRKLSFDDSSASLSSDPGPSVCGPSDSRPSALNVDARQDLPSNVPDSPGIDVPASVVPSESLPCQTADNAAPQVETVSVPESDKVSAEDIKPEPLDTGGCSVDDDVSQGDKSQSVSPASGTSTEVNVSMSSDAGDNKNPVQTGSGAVSQEHVEVVNRSDNAAGALDNVKDQHVVGDDVDTAATFVDSDTDVCNKHTTMSVIDNVFSEEETIMEVTEIKSNVVTTADTTEIKSTSADKAGLAASEDNPELHSIEPVTSGKLEMEITAPTADNDSAFKPEISQISEMETQETPKELEVLKKQKSPGDEEPPEGEPSIGAELSEAEPSKGAELSESAPSKGAELSESEPSQGAELSKAEPSKEAELSKAEPSKEAELSESEPSKGVEVSKAEPSKEAELSESEPSKGAELSKVEFSKEAELSKTEPSKEAELPEKALPSKKAELKSVDQANVGEKTTCDISKPACTPDNVVDTPAEANRDDSKPLDLPSQLPKNESEDNFSNVSSTDDSKSVETIEKPDEIDLVSTPPVSVSDQTEQASDRLVGSCDAITESTNECSDIPQTICTEEPEQTPGVGREDHPVPEDHPTNADHPDPEGHPDPEEVPIGEAEKSVLRSLEDLVPTAYDKEDLDTSSANKSAEELSDDVADTNDTRALSATAPLDDNAQEDSPSTEPLDDNAPEDSPSTEQAANDGATTSKAATPSSGKKSRKRNRKNKKKKVQRGNSKETSV